MTNSSESSEKNFFRKSEKLPPIKPLHNPDRKIQTNIINTKTEFQKNLMNDNKVSKYKSSCLILLKEEEELANLIEKCEISNCDEFIDNMFSDHIFLYKLEYALNYNFKKKDKIFKQEIGKLLNALYIELECGRKLLKLNNEIDNYINNIKEFKFYI
jgi:hypothetical protein